MRYFVANGEKTWGRWIEARDGFEARRMVSNVCPGTYPRDFLSIPAHSMGPKEIELAKRIAR